MGEVLQIVDYVLGVNHRSKRGSGLLGFQNRTTNERESFGVIARSPNDDDTIGFRIEITSW